MLFLFLTIVLIVCVRVCIDRDRRVQQVNSLGLFWWRFTNFSPLNDTRMFLVVAREQYGPTLAAKITDNMVLDEDEETIGQGWFKISTHACWSTNSLFSFHVQLQMQCVCNEIRRDRTVCGTHRNSSRFVSKNVKGSSIYIIQWMATVRRRTYIHTHTHIHTRKHVIIYRGVAFLHASQTHQCRQTIHHHNTKYCK